VFYFLISYQLNAFHRLVFNFQILNDAYFVIVNSLITILSYFLQKISPSDKQALPYLKTMVMSWLLYVCSFENGSLRIFYFLTRRCMCVPVRLSLGRESVHSLTHVHRPLCRYVPFDPFQSTPSTSSRSPYVPLTFRLRTAGQPGGPSLMLRL